MKTRAGLLIAAYVILVAVVVFGAFFIQREFDQAHDDQCSIARATALVLSASILLGTDGESVPADVRDDARALLTQAQTEIAATCGPAAE